MEGRIGALHVRYRIPPASAGAAALAPGLDRAIRTRLGEAVAARMSLVFGGDPSVVVIRELNTRVALNSRDLTLDSRAIERISRASVDAVADLLHESDTPDAVMRFADQAEFVGSFLLDVLQGTAWDRWYFGAFQSYRRADVRDTIAAVLADRQTECARIFAWLARRGRLRDVIALIGSRQARHLVSGRMTDAAVAAQPDVEALVEAAFVLVEALGWPVTDPADRRSVLAGFLSSAAVPPSWSDRRALSAWVLECVRTIVATFGRAGTRPNAHARATTQELLTGSLDWLDTGWLSEELQRLRDAGGVSDPPRPARARLLAAHHERMLARLARRIGEGRVRLDRESDRDASIVRLVAAVSEESDPSVPVDRALIAAIERIVDAWQLARAADCGPAALARILHAPNGAPAAEAPHVAREFASRLGAVAAAGPTAIDVLRALVGATSAAGEAGDQTEFGGLYLLTRGILDVRLPMHAREAGVPWDLLRLALATEWFGLRAPFDKPTSVWLGTPSEDLAPLSEFAASLARLERSILMTLLDQHAIEAAPPGDGDPRPAAIVTRVAWMVMRAWSRWLPGIAQASPAFLVAKGLTRNGRVRVSESRIDVALEPAALDAVFQMAGYFKPLESVGWLGDRIVTFTVDRSIGS